MDIDRAALMQVFLSDSEEDLARLEQAVLVLEDYPDDLKTVDAIFRIAHTLKGNASILALDGFSRMAHSLEEVLHAVRARQIPVTSELTTLCLAAVDAFRDTLASLSASGREDIVRHEALEAELIACAAAGKVPAGQAGEGERPATTSREESPMAPLENRGSTVLRVDVAQIDQLLDLAARASVMQGQMGTMLLATADPNGDLWELHEKSEKLLMELQDWIIDARMIPMSRFLRSHARTVRDAARTQRKRARLRLECDNVRVDAGIGDTVRDVITHLVRNAIDHGIEPPGTRASRGKQPEGTITVRANQAGNQVVLQVSDDGAGFNLSKIRARARTLGRPNVESLSPDALYRLAFEPGFSTAEKVTELSGRGVGMDVVLRSVEDLHGTVEIDSNEGVGSTIELRLPLTLSVVEGFWIDVAGTQYVLPVDDVLECVDVPRGREETVASEGIIDVRGEPLVYLHLREIFAVGGQLPPAQRIVVARHRAGRVGLAVDDILGQRQTVIKPLGRLFRTVPGISGSTMRPDGNVALVIDVTRLLRAPGGRARDAAGKAGSTW